MISLYRSVWSLCLSIFSRFHCKCNRYKGPRDWCGFPDSDFGKRNGELWQNPEENLLFDSRFEDLQVVPSTVSASSSPTTEQQANDTAMDNSQTVDSRETSEACAAWRSESRLGKSI